jgi:hypothetical protein
LILLVLSIGLNPFASIIYNCKRKRENLITMGLSFYSFGIFLLYAMYPILLLIIISVQTCIEVPVSKESIKEDRKKSLTKFLDINQSCSQSDYGIALLIVLSMFVLMCISTYKLARPKNGLAYRYFLTGLKNKEFINIFFLTGIVLSTFWRVKNSAEGNWNGMTTLSMWIVF